MLLAEELALLALDPDKGRPDLGYGAVRNACLAGLLVAELLLEGVAVPGERDGTVALLGGPPAHPALAGAAQVITERGPKIKAVLSHMSRGLAEHAGAGTWDLAVGGLVGAGVIGPAQGKLVPHHEILDPAAREAVVDRLRQAAASDEPMPPRTAVLLSMTGPAYLLQVVTPDRAGRKHARLRIDHALDSTGLEVVGATVRKVLAEAAAAAYGVAATGAVISSS